MRIYQGLAYVPFYAIGIFIMVLIIIFVWNSTGDKKPIIEAPKAAPPKHAFFEGTNNFERQVYHQLLTMFEARYVFMNVLLGEAPHSTQIDHIVLTRKAIFVIEVKDYKGKIEGQLQQDEWKQTLEYVESTPSRYVSYTRRGKPYRRHYLKDKVQVHSIYNPYRQNQGHITVIRYHLKGLSIPVVNWVIFSNRSLLYSPAIDQQDTFVIQQHEMNYMMKAYLDTRPNIIPQNTLNNIENLIVNLNQANDLNMKKHIESFQ